MERNRIKFDSYRDMIYPSRLGCLADAQSHRCCSSFSSSFGVKSRDECAISFKWSVMLYGGQKYKRTRSRDSFMNTA